MYKSKFTGQEIDNNIEKINNLNVDEINTQIIDLQNQNQSQQTQITDLQNKINNSLQVPATAPTATELVGIDTNNAQVNIGIGEGLSLENGTLKSTGGGGAKGGIPTVTESEINNPTDESENLVYYNGSVYCLIKED